jgi:DNA polymerase III subunit alpha, Gram-positive type
VSSREFRTRPIIITDVETTGLDPRTHEIVEIGAIAVDHDLKELNRFNLKVIPEHIHTAEPEALVINGYDPKLWMNAGSQFTAAREFRDFSMDGILGAWNITFEYNFLEALFRRMGYESGMDYHRIDIPSIAWMLIPSLKYLSLDMVAKHFGLQPEPKPHRGITGAEYELEVLRFLKGRALLV